MVSSMYSLYFVKYLINALAAMASSVYVLFFFFFKEENPFELLIINHRHILTSLVHVAHAIVCTI